MKNTKINQLIKELEGITPESINLNKRYFQTTEFKNIVVWRLKEILDTPDGGK